MAIPEVLTKFDPFAFTHPKTEEDVLALLDEALLNLQYVNEAWDKIIEELERCTKKRP